MILNRRRFLAASASVNALAMTPPAAAYAAKLVGIHDRPFEARKFRGDGWYGFRAAVGWGIAVQHVIYDGRQFYALADEPGGPPNVYLSAGAFDRCCEWHIEKVAADAPPLVGGGWGGRL